MHYAKTLAAAAAAAISIGTAADAFLVVEYGGTGTPIFDQDGNTNGFGEFMADATEPFDDFTFDLRTSGDIVAGEYGIRVTNTDILESGAISVIGTDVGGNNDLALDIMSTATSLFFRLTVVDTIAAGNIIASVGLGQPPRANEAPDDEASDLIISDWNGAGTLDVLNVFEPTRNNGAGGAYHSANIDLQTTIVPVPASALLLGSGFAAAFAMRRRRKS